MGMMPIKMQDYTMDLSHSMDPSMLPQRQVDEGDQRSVQNRLAPAFGGDTPSQSHPRSEMNGDVPRGSGQPYSSL